MYLFLSRTQDSTPWRCPSCFSRADFPPPRQDAPPQHGKHTRESAVLSLRWRSGLSHSRVCVCLKGRVHPSAARAVSSGLFCFQGPCWVRALGQTGRLDDGRGGGVQRSVRLSAAWPVTAEAERPGDALSSLLMPPAPPLAPSRLATIASPAPVVLILQGTCVTVDFLSTHSRLFQASWLIHTALPSERPWGSDPDRSPQVADPTSVHVDAERRQQERSPMATAGLWVLTLRVGPRTPAGQQESLRSLGPPARISLRGWLRRDVGPSL